MKLKQPDIKGFNPLDTNNEKSKPTPMMQQYLEVKSRHEEYLLFYRMGDFYELFFEDAKIAASELGIALTKRGKLNDVDIPMCGVPAHSSQTYLSRLIASGHKVAVAEQLENRVDERNFSKYQKIFKRDVVKIITPGTILDESLLQSKSNNHLMSISFHKGDISVSWTDISTGSIKLKKIKDGNLMNDLFESINRVEPEEIIVPKIFDKINVFESTLKKFKEKITHVPSSFFDLINNREKIKNFFKNQFLDSIKELNTTDIQSLGAILNYLELTQKENIPLINEIEIVDEKNNMQIDDFSVRSLEIFCTNFGDKKGSLLDSIDHTKTAVGGRLLKNFLKSPLVKKEKIIERHNLVNEFVNNNEVTSQIINILSNQPDAERALLRISARTNNPRDLILIINFLKSSELIYLELEKIKNPLIKSLFLDNDSKKKLVFLKEKLEKNIMEVPPVNINEGGIFKSGIDENLDVLRNIKHEKQKEILKMQTSYCSLTNISNLKIKFNNIHGYFIEVTNKNSEILKTFKEKEFNLIQNTVNNSRFQTTELSEVSREIQNSQEKSIELEKRLYKQITEFVKELNIEIITLSNKIALIDVISNFANLAYKRNYSKPEICENQIIDIKNCRHPVVEESLKSDLQEFNPNNCEMDKNSFAWLMTGPNMAGKSTFLRQIAISVILNQIGSFIPADSAKIGIFDKIFTRIGASDNLSKGMSTFMTEMTETAKIINEATNKSLVILDELGRGTSTEDGLAISQSILEYILTDIRCITLFATHFKQLCSLSEKYSCLKLKTLKIKQWNDEIIFLHKVIDGISQGSFGIHVASMAGINSKILNRSKKILEKLSVRETQNFSVVDNDSEKNEIVSRQKNYSELSGIINKVNLDEVSPKEALDILYAIKKLL
ncbi:MAG: DNA mismatch repair protein MutS [Alphaproteobacteria bacterium]